jgi:hypothetical protein
MRDEHERDQRPDAEPEHELQRLARRPRTSLPRELLDFLRETRKWWLAPILICLLLLGLLMLFGGGAAGPFIYTFF